MTEKPKTEVHTDNGNFLSMLSSGVSLGIGEFHSWGNHQSMTWIGSMAKKQNIRKYLTEWENWWKNEKKSPEKPQLRKTEKNQTQGRFFYYQNPVTSIVSNLQIKDSLTLAKFTALSLGKNTGKHIIDIYVLYLSWLFGCCNTKRTRPNLYWWSFSWKTRAKKLATVTRTPLDTLSNRTQLG